jgi:hypothetical protein
MLPSFGNFGEKKFAKFTSPEKYPFTKLWHARKVPQKNNMIPQKSTPSRSYGTVWHRKRIGIV